MMRQHHERRQGFTLIEVLISVLILALSLSAIFASSTVAGRMSAHSRNDTVASLLARCKMGEIEEEIMKEGLPADFSQGNDACCEGGEIDGFTCEWLVDRVEIPEDVLLEEEGLEGETAEGTNEGSVAGLELGEQATPQDLLSGLGTGGFSGAIMNFVFPILKPTIEEQIRRATVRVKWNEGTREHEFVVVQFLVKEGVATGSVGEEGL